jgi:hypothetical protein
MGPVFYYRNNKSGFPKKYEMRVSRVYKIYLYSFKMYLEFIRYIKMLKYNLQSDWKMRESRSDIKNQSFERLEIINFVTPRPLGQEWLNSFIH